MELNKMKMPQLRRLAKERNLRGYSRLRKAELINFINESLCEEPVIEQPQDEKPQVTNNLGNPMLYQKVSLNAIETKLLS